MNELILMNYSKEKAKTGINIGDCAEIIIEIISGDEVAKIKYKGGKRKRIDSAVIINDMRIWDFHDGEYVLLDENINRIEEFNKRKDSYDLLGF